ncbi:MAG: DUF305 domain-containing protein [Cyanobacteria bacterium]|nr:DUF305 domain-containing protein [Cyanobacteriota bacterium]
MIAVVASPLLWLTPAFAQEHHHHHHGHHGMPAAEGAAKPSSAHAHAHDLGPAGETYDLRWLDAMVQHHTGALRMSEELFDVGQPGLGALANDIWYEQAREIKAMRQWRKRWYPEAPMYPVAWREGSNPDDVAQLPRMTAEQIQGMQMMGSKPTEQNRVVWFLEGMLMHHGVALQMAHDALRKSKTTAIQRLSQQIILSQRHEINRLRQMLRHQGLNKPEYRQFDRLFTLKPQG